MSIKDPMKNATVSRTFDAIRKNGLLSAMVTGTVGYELFAHVDCLVPVGDSLGPYVPDLLPVGLFLLLYFTFCRIKIADLRPRVWHFAIQAARVCLSGSMVALICLGQMTGEWKLVLEGIFVCFICPTASAVVVVAEKLGGSVGSLTIFTIIANMVTMIIIPLFFPLVERGADITFISAVLILLRKVFWVLVAPLALAMLSRRFLPGMVQKFNRYRNTGFYLWCMNLMIVTGVTLSNIEHSAVSGWVLWALLLAPLPVCLLQFALGKEIGRRLGDSVSAGQALGQKNTVVGIWLTLTFLNPLAAVAPGAYVLWQNLFNSWQLWYMNRYGRLLW